jgi:hypothetical protein
MGLLHTPQNMRVVAGQYGGALVAFSVNGQRFSSRDRERFCHRL